jgi:aminopeptidase YwaD
MDSALQRLGTCEQVVTDFKALTSFGGRLIGSPSEENALAWLRRRLHQIDSASLKEHRFEYNSWACIDCRLDLRSGGESVSVRCHPLYWSSASGKCGLEAKVVDGGRGTETDLSATDIRGKMVMVRHEYPFATGSIHRRVKYNRSRELGAAGFIIANNIPGDMLVTGSCGQDSPANIPAMGVSRSGGEQITAYPDAVACMRLFTERTMKIGVNLFAEVAGQTDEWIVVSAHYDGHNLAQSALDNATGVAASLSILQHFAPLVGKLRRGLRVALFSAEETGLLGSARYVDSLSAAERKAIALNINLDMLAGSRHFTCLTSEFEDLDRFVIAVSAMAGIDLATHGRLLRNSDHFNFARVGIPALRLIAGFDKPKSGARFVLTEGDNFDRVSLDEVKFGASVAAEIVWSALNWPGPIAVR